MTLPGEKAAVIARWPETLVSHREAKIDGDERTLANRAAIRCVLTAEGVNSRR
jgi:hypothetical protein